MTLTSRLVELIEKVDATAEAAPPIEAAELRRAIWLLEEAKDIIEPWEEDE